jgi:allantoin racemase
MMKVLVINPNTSQEMTRQVEGALRAVKEPDTSLLVVNPDDGPRGLSSARDDLFAGGEVVRLIKRYDSESYDGVLIAAYCDPGLTASKEVCSVPVVGIAETCSHVACLLGAKFSVLTSTDSRVPSKEVYVRTMGLGERLASVRALGVTAVEASLDPRRTKAAIMEVGRSAVEGDGAEVLILGCAGMAGYAEEVEQALGVPVLDPTAVALKVLEGLIRLHIRQSKVRLYAYPTSASGNGAAG